jgi:DNA-binding MarR family transcriptional regulator
MVTQLESRGFVERKSDRIDGRVRFLILTVRGNKVAHSVDKSSLERFSTMLNGIPAEARGRVLDALEILQRAIPVQSGEQQGHGDEE